MIFFYAVRYVLVEFGMAKISVLLATFVIVRDCNVEVLIFLNDNIRNILLKFLILRSNNGSNVSGV